MTNCQKTCDPGIVECDQQPSHGGNCSDSFTRWFYNSEEDYCTEVSYNGCVEAGFATKAECEACLCNE